MAEIHTLTIQRMCRLDFRHNTVKYNLSELQNRFSEDFWEPSTQQMMQMAIKQLPSVCVLRAHLSTGASVGVSNRDVSNKRPHR